jgi:hypothetical protein
VLLSERAGIAGLAGWRRFARREPARGSYSAAPAATTDARGRHTSGALMRRWLLEVYADHTSRSRRAESPRARSGYARRRRAPHRASRQGPRSRLAVRSSCATQLNAGGDGEARWRGRCGARRALRSRTGGAAIPGVDFRDCDPRKSQATSGASVRLADVVQVHPIVDAASSEYERRPRSRRAERAPTASLVVPAGREYVPEGCPSRILARWGARTERRQSARPAPPVREDASISAHAT